MLIKNKLVGRGQSHKIGDLYARRFAMQEFFGVAKNEHPGWSLAKTRIMKAEGLDRRIVIAAIAWVWPGGALGRLCRVRHGCARRPWDPGKTGRRWESALTCVSTGEGGLNRNLFCGSMPCVTNRLAYRVGHGWDLHRLEPGHKLIVGGLRLEHDRGCDAHSDGDVVYHALTDAILGALGMDDIGQLFPDNDPQWKGADSRLFVQEAVKRMRGAGYQVGNVDVTIVLQKPRISPHKAAMKKNLAELLGADLSRINVKGKTHEQVDAIGRGQAIGCHVVAMLLGDG